MEVVSRMDKDKLYREAVSYWGRRKQMRMVQEECAELILAVSHYLRMVDRGEEWNNSGLDNLVEETADVLNMAEQLRYMVGTKLVDKVREEKLERVEKKLKRYKGERS